LVLNPSPCSSCSYPLYTNKTHPWHQSSYLHKEDDEEVEVGNSSKLLKKVLREEVPEGVLWGERGLTNWPRHGADGGLELQNGKYLRETGKEFSL